jgi:hypothetical protein
MVPQHSDTSDLLRSTIIPMSDPQLRARNTLRLRRGCCNERHSGFWRAKNPKELRMLALDGQECRQEGPSSP